MATTLHARVGEVTERIVHVPDGSKRIEQRTVRKRVAA